MLNSKFSMLINDMKQYVTKSVEIRGKIADLQQNGVKIYSHEKIEKDVNALIQQLRGCAAEKQATGEKTVAAIKEELQSTSTALDLAVLQPLFSYLSAAGAKASVPIVENQIVKFAGNADAITAIRETAENNGCTSGVIQTIKSYYVSAETVESELMKELVTVYTAGGSATDAGKHIVDIAKHCGAVVTSDIVDEYNDNLLLRKAFGLA